MPAARARHEKVPSRCVEQVPEGETAVGRACRVLSATSVVSCDSEECAGVHGNQGVLQGCNWIRVPPHPLCGVGTGGVRRGCDGKPTTSETYLLFVCSTRNVLTICAFASYVGIELRQGEGGGGQRQEPETGGEVSSFVRETAEHHEGWGRTRLEDGVRQCVRRYFGCFSRTPGV